jgi:hypothetical protein
MTKDMAEDMSDIKQEILMKENFKITKLMVEEYINGSKEKYMMVSGYKVKNMDMEYGEEFMEIAT